MLVVSMNALKWRDWGSCASIEFQRRGEERGFCILFPCWCMQNKLQKFGIKNKS